MFIIVFFGAFAFTYGQNFTFLDNVINSPNFDKRARPGDGKPVNVKVQVHVLSLANIKELTFTYEAEFYLRYWWHDSRFHMNNSKLDELNTNIPAEQLFWTPDLTITNARKITNYDTAIRSLIKSNGEIYYVRRLKAIAECIMDLHHYPMDQQTCKMVFESFAFSNKEMVLKWHEKPVLYPHKLETPGYNIEEITAEHVKLHLGVGSGTESYDNLIVYFRVRRTFLYFLYRTYIPSFLLMIFNMASYWIPISAIPARVALMVTTFLASTFILQSVSEDTVKVSYTTAMQLFMLVNVILISISIIEFIVVIFLKGKRRTKSKPSPAKDVAAEINPGYAETREHWHKPVRKVAVVQNERPLRKTYGKGAEPPQKENEQDISYVIDLIFRIVCPVLYVSFCFIYFVYYFFVV